MTQQGQQVQQQQGGGNTAQPLSYATRVSPATIQWLVANYETAEGIILFGSFPQRALTNTENPPHVEIHL